MVLERQELLLTRILVEIAPCLQYAHRLIYTFEMVLNLVVSTRATRITVPCELADVDSSRRTGKRTGELRRFGLDDLRTSLGRFASQWHMVIAKRFQKLPTNDASSGGVVVARRVVATLSQTPTDAGLVDAILCLYDAVDAPRQVKDLVIARSIDVINEEGRLDSFLTKTIAAFCRLPWDRDLTVRRGDRPGVMREKMSVLAAVYDAVVDDTVNDVAETLARFAYLISAARRFAASPTLERLREDADYARRGGALFFRSKPKLPPS